MSTQKTLIGTIPIKQIEQEVTDFMKKVVEDSSVILDVFDLDNDPEGRSEITLDASNKIVSYRKEDGTKVECAGIETPCIKAEDSSFNNVTIENADINGGSAFFESLNLTEDGMTEFQQALINSGFNPKSIIDWSDEKFVQIPIPNNLARINIITETIPTQKTDKLKATLEYWDMGGNYFKKPIKKFGCQGNSSLGYAIKNFKFDTDDGSKWKFGHWVPQDSFHLKSFYIDVFVGVGNMLYNYVESLYKRFNNRPSRIAFDDSEITSQNGTGDLSQDFGTGAMCHPEGFPVELYINGEYYALYAFNLKKDRDNYLMDKKDYKTVRIDGFIHDHTFFSGNVPWNTMELGNPKDMICMDGSEYSDDDPKELIDETSEFWDETNKVMKNTRITKNMLIEFSQKWNQIQQMVNAADAMSDPDAKAAALLEAKEFLATFYDIDTALMFYLISELIWNRDGIYGSNTQWLIYHGNKMAPSFYDLDSVFGRCGNGMGIFSHTEGLIMHGGQLRAYKLLDKLYLDELKELYTTMRKEGYISTKYVMSFVNDYIERVGYTAYKRNIDMRNDKGFDIPSYRDMNLNSEYWMYISTETEGYSGYPSYNEETTYSVGDRCIVGAGQVVMIVECIKNNSSDNKQHPFILYGVNPQYFGVFDCPKRIEKWLDERIENLDTYYLLTN